MSAYIKQGARVSLLPVSQFCGLAASLSEAHGAGRAAAMSRNAIAAIVSRNSWRSVP